ncbi:MAG: gamma carbonic anhydrase family protein [Rhodospirillaceae bacterium]|jgi:gamma-carbonic anhydrase|nr:gamma carbonic anhydrase family protein [Rhodospirillaceae bacterium]MBT6509447.1 gamma carbonic anhydrase family protein [Rhodospirillaceae bacterium]MBT7613281.1 gamma carbonic anhydrase family protein [Rhodospirillaceae bacterium]MBT7649287.1 gamma carbonic anhydrase family protein [Rhodospirillaceae bacterium]
MNPSRWPAPPGPIVMPFNGIWPTIDETAVLLSNAAVVGDVTLGPDSSVWFNAVVRGDDGPITVGRGSNIQDGCVVHVSDIDPTVIGDWVTLGHCVHLHGCRLEDETLIGSGAIVLDGAVVERHTQVAAGALIAPGKVVKSGELWGGVPGKKLRDLSEDEIKGIRINAEWYVHELPPYREQMEQTR